MTAQPKANFEAETTKSRAVNPDLRYYKAVIDNAICGHTH